MVASKTSSSNRFLTNEQTIFQFDVRRGGGNTTNFNDVTQSSKFTLIYAMLVNYAYLLNKADYLFEIHLIHWYIMFSRYSSRCSFVVTLIKNTCALEYFDLMKETFPQVLWHDLHWEIKLYKRITFLVS